MAIITNDKIDKLRADIISNGYHLAGKYKNESETYFKSFNDDKGYLLYQTAVLVYDWNTISKGNTNGYSATFEYIMEGASVQLTISAEKFNIPKLESYIKKFNDLNKKELKDIGII